MTDDDLKKEFQIIEDAFNKAVISNDSEKILACVSEDWVIVDPQNGIIPGERFLSVVKQGVLKHSSMTKEILRVKVYGNIALVTGRGKNTGTFNAQAFEMDEWVTDIYENKNDKWICVLTHLTPVVKKI